MLHSSFKGLARTGVKAESILQGMCDYFTDGNVLFPTMTWKTVTPSQPIFNANSTSSHTGYLTELFRTQYATERSLHPTHSVAGRGKSVEKLLCTHHLAPSPCSMQSPYGKIFTELDHHQCYIGLLDVGLESCTYIHFFEEFFAPNVYLDQSAAPIQYQLIDLDGVSHPYMAIKQSNISRNFHQIGDELLQRQQLKSFSYANSRILLFTLQDLFSVLEDGFAHSQYATSPSYLVGQ
nr:AAC(3) family N-acetyltransferase [Pseudoalteromonas luteoviolacea]